MLEGKVIRAVMAECPEFVQLCDLLTKRLLEPIIKREANLGTLLLEHTKAQDLRTSPLVPLIKWVVSEEEDDDEIMADDDVPATSANKEDANEKAMDSRMQDVHLSSDDEESDESSDDDSDGAFSEAEDDDDDDEDASDGIVGDGNQPSG